MYLRLILLSWVNLILLFMIYLYLRFNLKLNRCLLHFGHTQSQNQNNNNKPDDHFSHNYAALIWVLLQNSKDKNLGFSIFSLLELNMPLITDSADLGFSAQPQEKMIINLIWSTEPPLC